MTKLLGYIQNSTGYYFCARCAGPGRPMDMAGDPAFNSFNGDDATEERHQCVNCHAFSWEIALDGEEE